MKKIIMLCCLLLLVCGCQKTEEKKVEKETPTTDTTAPKENTSLKLDEAKDYVYVASSVEAKLSDEQKPYFEKRDKAIDTLVVNINSEDAKKVSQELEKSAKSLQEEMSIGDDGYVARFTSLSGAFHMAVRRRFSNLSGVCI